LAIARTNLTGTCLRECDRQETSGKLSFVLIASAICIVKAH
jgi:hypothetical protein